MKKYKLSALCGTALLLTACGGGGSSESPAAAAPAPACKDTQYLENSSCKDKATQMVSGLTLPDTINVDQILILSAQSSAGLAVSYSSKTEKTCRIRDNRTVEMRGAGICTVEASQAGNSKVLPAAPVSASSAILSVLTATGMKLCGSSSQNNLNCDAASLGELLGLGQDAEIQAGRKMAYSAVKYNKDECIRDQVTGLIWEQKTADGTLRDKDWRYSWFNADPKTNGGNAGIQAGSAACGSTLSSCSTAAYINALNKANYCGYSDWRLPARSELASLMDYSVQGPSLNPLFINTAFTDRYWSSSTGAKQDAKAWMADFKDGESAPGFKEYMGHIRAVRSGQ